MNAQIRTTRIVLPLLVCGLALAGCSTGDDTADTTGATSEASGSALAEGDAMTVLTLTFSSETCTYDGPSEVPAGTTHLTFVNDTEGYASAELFSVDDGYTYEDVLDAVGEGPISEKPYWVREIGVYDMTPAGETQEWEHDLDAGLYMLFCVDTSPKAAYLGGSVTLTE